MFAEEVENNANRKRQEENRARRKKLKQEQLKKKKNEEQKIRAQDPTVNKPVSTVTKPVINVTPDTAISATSTNVSNSVHLSNTQTSAVEIATAQRQQRHEAQVQKRECIKIQSFYRAHRSNCFLIKAQITLLAKRLQDLSTLISILKEKANTDYIPTQQTVTAFCQQTIFLTRTIPYHRKKNQHGYMYTKLRDTKRDSKLVQQIFQLVLIPGLTSLDQNINPFAVWIQSPEGKLRIQYMMRLALVIATDPLVDSTIWKSCLNFIQIVTVSISMSTNNSQNNINDDTNIIVSIVEFCRPLLLKNDSSKKRNPVEQPTLSSLKSPAKNSVPLDLITLLRNHLLYSTGGSPNPLTSSKLRESCISSKQREQADRLFQTVILVIQGGGNGFNNINNDKNNNNRRSKQNIFKQSLQEELEEILMLRFFSEILTIPLLTWKISDTSMKYFFSYRHNNFSQQNQLFLMSLIGTFTNVHSEIMNVGDIESVLCDIPLKQARATSTQCLLANMIQLGSSCIQLNGSQPDKLDFEASSIYFRFLATLVDAIPVSTFSSRDSVVEWVSDSGHHSPVVLSPIILEHCRILVADGWVRKLFLSAVDPDHLKMEQVLIKKNDKDLRMEKELSEVGSNSVASVAAKEARVDRNRSFWKSSAWARNLTKGVSKILNSSNNKGGEIRLMNKIPSIEGGRLINASVVSRKLTLGKEPAKAVSLDKILLSSITTSGNQRPSSYSPDLLKSLCRVYGIILARWGGNGCEDIVHQKRVARQMSKKEVASTSPEPCTQSFLSVLCFSTNFVRVSWAMIQSEGMSPVFGHTPVKSTCVRPMYKDALKERQNHCLSIFYLFVESLAYQLILTDDTEIHDRERPIPLHQFRRCIIALKHLLYKACCTDDAAMSNPDSKHTAAQKEANYFGLALIKASSKTMLDLYDRSSRRLICVPTLWIVDDLMETELRRCKTELDYVSLLSAPVLRICPFLVSFKRRLRLFERIVFLNRSQIQGENSTNPFNSNPLKPAKNVRITRGRILEDGLATMNNLGSDMRQRISIQYFNEAGTREPGIDAGGLFKEFWTDLCKIAFDPNYALFCVTEDNCMYPNPSSGAAHGNDHIELFMFLGRVLGKSLYESITVHPQFAHFFLSFLRGDYNYFHMFSDLSTIDSQLYNNLMFLKTYDNNVEDLCLSFTVSVDDFGGKREIPLLPNGTNIDVTNSNKHRYIGKCLTNGEPAKSQNEKSY